MTMIKKGLWLVASMLVASGCDPDPKGITAVTEPTGFAVTHGDYVSSAIALLAPDGTLEQDRFVHSGTVFDGLGSALSGDVVLPTVATEPGVLTYVERKGTDLVTLIDIAAGEVTIQTGVQVATDSAYQPNPSDYVQVSDSTAWITRNAPNLSVPDGDDDEGNDLFYLPFLNNGESVGRIDFSALDTTGSVTNIDTGEVTQVAIYARPSRMVKVGGYMVVGLERISLAYDAIGSGMIAIAALAAKTVEPVALDGLSNCGNVLPVEGDASRVIVSCLGSFLGDPREESGVVILHVVDGAATIEHVWAAADHANDPIAVSNLVSLGGSRVIAIAAGDFATTTDTAYVLDVENGDLEMVAEADGSYVLGSGAYNPATKVLLLPDASADANMVVTAGLRRFQWDAADVVTELELVQTDPDLPVRSVAALR